MGRQFRCFVVSLCALERLAEEWAGKKGKRCEDQTGLHSLQKRGCSHDCHKLELRLFSAPLFEPKHINPSLGMVKALVAQLAQFARARFYVESGRQVRKFATNTTIRQKAAPPWDGG